VLREVRRVPVRDRRPLLYLAGADISRDLAGELAARGIEMVTRTTYRMVAIADLPPDVCDAFAANRIEAVLHYSARSADAFLEAARAVGVEISALAVPHCCISPSVARVLREAGATRVVVAASPKEDAARRIHGRVPNRVKKLNIFMFLISLSAANRIRGSSIDWRRRHRASCFDAVNGVRERVRTGYRLINQGIVRDGG